MKIVDANIILRYLLNDSGDLSERAAKILENNMVFVPNEVIAEIVYVLEKVYKVEKGKISIALLELFEYGNLQLWMENISGRSFCVETIHILSKIFSLVISR